LRDARITAIYEGTTGIQANDLLGRKLARDKGAAMRGLIADLLQRLGPASDDPPEVAAGCTAARAALQQLQRTTDELLQMAAASTPAGYAVSVPFLFQCGFVLGGALLVNGAQVAARELQAGCDDAPFMRAKIECANFYVAHWLPQARAQAEVVGAGANTVIDASSELI
jgi:hypothetical protein